MKVLLNTQIRKNRYIDINTPKPHKRYEMKEKGTNTSHCDVFEIFMTSEMQWLVG
jgi:hypothetical protein